MSRYYDDALAGLIKRTNYLERRLVISETVDNAALTHSVLLGLDADDHTQYHNDTRGDVRYYTQTQLNANQLGTLYYTQTRLQTSGSASVHWGNITNKSAADLTHNNLAGLTTGDPHTQYFLLAGRGGGQVVYAGTGAADSYSFFASSGNSGGGADIAFDFWTGTDPSDHNILTMYHNGRTYIRHETGVNVAPSTDAQLDVVSGDAGRIGMRVKSATSPTALTVDVGDYGSPQFANAAMGVRRDVDNITALLLQNASTGTGADVRIAMYVSGDVADGSLAFSLPGTANAGSAIFNLARATSAFLFSRNRALGIGTFESHDLVLGTNNAARMIVKSDGKVGIGGTAPSGKTHIDQSSTTAAIPVLILDQADLSEEFVQFNTTVGAGNPVDTAAVGTYYGKIRVSVNGTAKYIALYNS